MADDSINENEIFEQFKLDELFSNLFIDAYNDLRKRNRSVVGKGKMFNPDAPLQSLLGVQDNDFFPKTTAKYIAKSVSYLMMVHYMNLRLNNDKNHCDAIIDVQTNFLELAYNVVTGGIENIDELKDETGRYEPLKTLNSGYTTFCSYVGENPIQYLELLADVTHTVLTKIHPMCEEDLDNNRLALTKKYLI